MGRRRIWGVLALGWVATLGVPWPDSAVAQNPLTATVRRIDDDVLFLDRGSQDGMLEGTLYEVHRVADGDTSVGLIQIQEVLQTVSVGAVLELQADVLQAGDRVSLVSRGVRPVDGPLPEIQDALLTPMLVSNEPAQVVAHTDLPLAARANGIDGLVSVDLFYRMGKAVEWSRVPMRRYVGDLYTGVIPAEALTVGILEYYLTAVDVDDRIGYLGSAVAPLAAPVLDEWGRGPVRPAAGWHPTALVPGWPQWRRGAPFRSALIAAFQIGTVVAGVFDVDHRVPYWGGAGAVYVFHTVDALMHRPARPLIAGAGTPCRGPVLCEAVVFAGLQFTW